jgi:hypothetical protein
MSFHMKTREWILCGLILLALISVFSSAVSENATIPVSLNTVVPPANLTVSVQLDQHGQSINATFRGGQGQILVKEIQMQVIHPDGTTDTGVLGNTVGETIVLKGSGCGDQVLGTVYYKNGMSYLFLNEKMQYLSGICPADYNPYTDPCADIAASPSLKPDPIQEIPANKSVIIQAAVDISTIEIQFRGGFGQNLIKTLQVSRIGPDGAKEIKDLGNMIGDQVTFPATNNCMDRIAADVSFIDGTQYHFFDEVLHISRYQ